MSDDLENRIPFMSVADWREECDKNIAEFRRLQVEHHDEMVRTLAWELADYMSEEDDHSIDFDREMDKKETLLNELLKKTAN